MKPAILIGLVPLCMWSADLRVDHVSVAGRDLKAMQAHLASIGLQSEAGGTHDNHATEMALVSFPDGSYLELIAIQLQADPDALSAHYWSKHLKAEGGPVAWAVRTKDISAEAKRLEAAGVPVGKPQASGRVRPDGLRLEWETAQVGKEPNGTFFPFLIRDITPRDKRASPRGRPTTKEYQGVSKVVIAVRDLKASIQRYRDAYDLPAPIQRADADFGGHMAWFGTSPIVLAAPVNIHSWIQGRLDEFGEGPCAFILRKSGSIRPRVEWMDGAKLGWWLGFQ